MNEAELKFLKAYINLCREYKLKLEYNGEYESKVSELLLTDKLYVHTGHIYFVDKEFLEDREYWLKIDNGEHWYISDDMVLDEADNSRGAK